MKPLTYYFHMKTKILANFQICVSVTLTSFQVNRCERASSLNGLQFEPSLSFLRKFFEILQNSNSVGHREVSLIGIHG